MKGKEAHIKSLIKDQENKVTKAQKRIEELNQELSDWLSGKAIQAIKSSSELVDAHNYCGKILYPSKKAATSARKLINRDLNKAGKPPMRRSYFCTQCDAWHLTTIGHWTEIAE